VHNRSGADLLAGDPLGGFNLTLKTPVHCVDYVAALGKPLLLLGGGEYVSLFCFCNMLTTRLLRRVPTK